MQCARRWRSTSRTESTVSPWGSKFAGVASRKRWIRAGESSRASTRYSAGVRPRSSLRARRLRTFWASSGERGRTPRRQRARSYLSSGPRCRAPPTLGPRRALGTHCWKTGVTTQPRSPSSVIMTGRQPCIPMSLRALIAALLLVPGLAAAVELGRLTVLSGVGEPLRAEIDVLAVRPGEAGSLGARIPPAEVFWRANIEPSPALNQIRVRVERRAKDRHVVVLHSNEPFEDPFLQLLVELTSAAGSVVREYPVLLDEPRTRGAGGGAAPAGESVVREYPVPLDEPKTRATRGSVARAPRQAQTELLAEAVPSPGPAGAGGKYVVQPGDTLATIAQGLKTTTATLDQMLVALYHANEQAFVDGNMNRLRTGEVLAVPPEAAALAVAPNNARQVVLEHQATLGDFRKQTSPGAPEAVTPAVAPRAARAATGDRLQVSRAETARGGIGAGAATAREDDIAALQHAFEEAKARIAMLEKSIDDLRKLLAVKKEKIALLEKDVGEVKPLLLANHELARLQHEEDTI